MKLLCISYEYPPVGGGGATVCQQVAEQMAINGHTVHVVTSKMKGLPRMRKEAGVYVHRVPCIRTSRHHATAIELATQVIPSIQACDSVIKSERPDIIHCHFIVPSGITARHVSRQHDIPYVLTAHGSDVQGYNQERFGLIHSVIMPYWRKIVEDAAAISAPSHFLTGLIQRQLDRDVELIPNAFRMPEYSQVPRNKQILMASRIVQRKGLQHLIEAFSRIDTDWRLVVAGDGPYLDTARNLAKTLGVSVDFLGMVDRKRLAELYAESGLFVFPSIRENLPMVLLEAMAAGCPSITSDADGCLEAAGNAAEVFEAGNVNSLKSCMEVLLADKQKRDDLAQMALDRAKHFSLPVVTSQFEALFKRILSEK